MPAPVDISGQTFGRWTVLEPMGRVGSRTQWKCRCACGHEALVSTNNLRRGVSRCCGRGACRVAAKKHGLRDTPEYEIWAAMKSRCTNSHGADYCNYGARGIQVCPRWMDDPAAFVADVGFRPSPKHTLDRIDVNGNYEPSNCRWATHQEQGNNRRNNVSLTVSGRTQTVSQWARERGVNPYLIHGRLRRGWSEEDAVMLPSLGYGNYYRRLNNVSPA